MNLTARLALALFAACGLHAAESTATGPAKETKLPPEQHLGAVKVTFDLLPTTMSFDLPWHFCSVTENWDQSEVGFRLEIDGKTLASGTDYRFGYEQIATGKDLVIWLNKTLDLNERDEHRAEVAIISNQP